MQKVASNIKLMLGILMIGILSVWGMPSSTFMRKTVRESMVEMANVIFSPDSGGIRNTHLKEFCVLVNH